MAQVVHTVITDDITGEELDEGEINIVELTFQGRSFRGDLGTESLAELEKLLDPYLEAFERVGGRRKSAKAKARRHSGPEVDTAAVRAWALENGHTVSDRGRIAKGVLDAYLAAHA